MKSFIKFSVAFLLIAMPIISQAYVGLCCGKCGGNMPMNTPGGGIPETHEWRIKLTPMIMSMSGLQDGDSSISKNDLLMNGMSSAMGGGMAMPMPGKYMAVPTAMDMEMFNVSLGYSFSDDFFAGLMLMQRSNSMDMAFNQAMVGMTGRNGFTMESDGLGDTMVMTKYRLYYDDPLIPKSQVSLFVGLGIPTGSIDEKNSNHPLAMRQDELLPYGMQLGSGTYDPTVGILYQGSRSPYWWGVNGMVTTRIGENDRDYSLGNEYKLDLFSMYQVSASVVLELQLNSSYKEEIDGEMDESATGASGRMTPGDASSLFVSPLWDTENYGGTKVGTTLGVQWQPKSYHIVNFQVGVPLYQNVNGTRLSDDYQVALTWYIEIPTSKSRRYKVKGKDDSELGF